MTFNGLAAVSDPANSHVTATTDDWSVDDAGIDQFELEASRRILANLRTEVVKEHLQHYAVEFRNGARMAAVMIRENDAADNDVFLSGDAAPTEGIAGDWHLEGSAGPAKREFDLTLTVDGQTARGTLASADGRSVDLDSGVIDGSTLAFKANLGMKVVFTLTFDGDTVTGKMKAGIMPATALTGTRR